MIVLLCAAFQFPAYALNDGTVSGVVRDAKGSPQIGTLVQLVKPDLSIIAQTFTDDHGHYTLPSILPGIYGIKATAALFLPTLRENLRIAPSSRLVVNLTLSTLYEAFRWLPAQPRLADEPSDDWTWTLRLSANRPLLRMLGDGPLVVVQEAEGQNSAMKARVTIRGGESGFGEGGVHNGFEMRRTNDDTRQVLLRADLSQAGSPALNTVVGYEQQLAMGRTLRTVAAFIDRPEIAGGSDMQGLQAMIFRTAETMDLSPAVQLEAGNEFEAVHLGTTTVANHPFGSVRVKAGDATVAYRVATTPGVQRGDQIDRASTLTPSIGESQGKLLLEHGLHQELSLSKSSGNVRWTMTVYRDRQENPMIEGGGVISSADWKSGDLLYDSATDSLRVTGQGFSSMGAVAELKDKLPGDMWISLAAGTGDTIMLAAQPTPVSIEKGLSGLHPARTEMYSAAFGGKLDRVKTQWQASYRWQQPSSLTAVDAFNKSLNDPYLSFYVRQPIHYRCILPNGMEALVDVRNLLAQGYRPMLTSDGSVLYFAEASRAVEGGLAFTF
jgi:Carboxypeptidase regulatory-like domain